MQTDCRKIKQKINWSGVTRMRAFATPNWSALMFFLIYWACIDESAARAQTHTSHGKRQREGRRSRQSRHRGKEADGVSRARSQATKMHLQDAVKAERPKHRRRDGGGLLISFLEVILWRALNIWGVTSACGPINNGWPTGLQQMGPNARAPAPPSRSPRWGHCPGQAATQGEVKFPKIAKRAQGRRGTQAFLFYWQMAPHIWNK